MSKTLMAPSFVRGDVVYVHSAPPAWAGAVSPMKGDRLTVGLRKKGGWLRVRNHRSGNVTNLRVGPWIQRTPVDLVPKVEAPAPVPTFNVQPAPSSGIDDLIRVHQIQSLEARIQQMSDEFFNEKTRLEACVDRLTEFKEVSQRQLETLEAQLEQQRTEAATNALQLIDAKSEQMALYERMTADAEAYHRRVEELMRENETLRNSEAELSEHLERATRQLHDIRPIGPNWGGEEIEYSDDEQEAAEVSHPQDESCC